MNMMPTQQLSISQQYTSVTAPLIPLIEQGKNYKQRVGETIFKFIQQLAPSERVPKITGMLIELPIEQVRQYMSNYDTLKAMAAEANGLIDHSAQ